MIYTDLVILLPFSTLKDLDVIAEKTVQVTNEEQDIVWEGYGLRLHIPPNSLPKSLNQCNVKIEVALSGNFQLPEDGVLVSAVYSFSHDLGDKELRRSVTLEMQHCATSSVLNDLRVVRAVDVPYKFEIFPGADFNRSDSYGAIKLRHFCCFGTILEYVWPSFTHPDHLKYCAKMYYTGISHLQFGFEIFIVRNLNSEERVCDVIVVCILMFIHVCHFYRLLKRSIKTEISSLSMELPQKFSLKRMKYVWIFLKAHVMAGV